MDSQAELGSKPQPKINPKPASKPESEPKSKLKIWPNVHTLTSIYIMLLNILLLYTLFVIWPSTTNQDEVTNFFGFDIGLNDEVRYFLVAAISGALGAFLSSVQKFIWYIGNQALPRSWLIEYIFRPFIGATFGVLAYLAFRGAFLKVETSAASMNPYTIGAVTAFAGIFNKRILDKIKSKFDCIEPSTDK
ncbi:MAG: hypothetical protein JW837_18345 [Sedimentisphaerales bacterium]|nr:hypothetical protein [Sedimentisphaerales bacterium]